MFTGIITHLGRVVDKSSSSLKIETDKELVADLTEGASVAVNGVCLTAIGLAEDNFSVDYIPETEKKTNIRYLRIGSSVNLELPATPNSLLSGHIVQGHIDGTARLESVERENNSRVLKFSITKNLSKYIVEKGSITVNGISLTVIDVEEIFFTVGIIPHTWDETMLRTVELGDYVNIEVDILAKYLEKLIKV